MTILRHQDCCTTVRGGCFFSFAWKWGFGFYVCQHRLFRVIVGPWQLIFWRAS